MASAVSLQKFLLTIFIKILTNKQNMKYNYIAIIFILHFNTFANETKKKIITAKAFSSKKAKNLIYIETHTILHNKKNLKKTITMYHNPQGKLIAKMDSDYEKNYKLPIYTFYNFTTKTKEGLRLLNDKYIIFYKKKNEEITKELEVKKDVFSGQGWHYYILNNLQEIKNSEKKTLNLIFPSRLDYYKFRIKKSEIKNVEKNTLNLILEFENWFFRFIFPSIELKYNTKTNKLISYYGPSNIKNKEGNSEKVYILYKDSE